MAGAGSRCVEVFLNSVLAEGAGEAEIRRGLLWELRS